jgi:hypothetical protein
MPRTRAKDGKFESTQIQNQDIGELLLVPSISKKWAYRIIFYIIILLIVSPWIFLMVKNHSFGSLSQKVTEFYDDNFSCQSREPKIEFKDDVSIKSTAFTL